MMKLWLISQTHNGGYDTYSDAVVAAETAEEASIMHPREWEKPRWDAGTNSWHVESYDTEYAGYGGWCNPRYVKVIQIGVALPEQLAEIILSSFHAG